MPKPKVIFIDWNKTLSNSMFWSQMRNLNHPHNKHVENIEKTLFNNNRNLINPWMRGEYSSEDICQIISNQSGIPFEIIFDGLKESCSVMEFISNEIPQLIKQLKSKGFKVVIATDNMDTFSRFTIPAMKLTNLFDDFLISCDIKSLKGDVEENSIPFFKDYLQQNNLNYNDSILLDDCNDMGDVYNRLGLEIIKITDENKLISILKEYAT